MHAHTVPADFWGCLIAKIFKRRKTVTTLHCPNVKKSVAFRLQRIAVNTCLSNKIIAVSGLPRHVAVNINYAKTDKIIVIPNSVDIAFFHPGKKGTKIRTEYSISSDTIIIGSIGRFIKSKGFEICLQVFAKVKIQYPKVKFLLCGYGEEEVFYRAVIKDLDIEDDVIFTGPRMDIDEIMAAIDIFLFTPFHSEGFGLVLIAAMAAGKPVVATNIYSDPCDIVLNNITGFLPFPEMPATDTGKTTIDPFVEKIKYLIENNEARGKLGFEGRRVAEEKYSTKIVMKQIEGIYEKLSYH